ncbi:trypsin-like peptidase domain-containing protein [Bradyrhizobium sp. USDA 4520]
MVLRLIDEFQRKVQLDVVTRIRYASLTHHFLAALAMYPVRLVEDALHFGDFVRVSFHRTLRVPETDRDHPLPPTFGRFSLEFPNENSRPEFAIPIRRREALWIAFEGPDWRPSAVKIGIGTVNAMDGRLWEAGLRSNPQRRQSGREHHLHRVATGIAFLKIGRRSDGAQQDRVLLADTDADAGTSLAVIGYPARAGEDVIPDQDWMERVFGGRYDVKRAAPGIIMPNSRRWATHDCTTLGGNSGSAVIDLATGKAVALHFAGAYVLENYAVPASTIRSYLKRRPWESPETVVTSRGDSGPATAGVTQAAPPAVMADTGQAASVSVTLPLTITVSIGSPNSGRGIAQATTPRNGDCSD